MLPILAVALVSCNKDNGDELSGDDIIQFEDQYFLEALLTVQEIEIYDAEKDDYISYTVDVDENKDGQISVNEAQKVRGLDFDSSEEYIEAMPEIKYFTALEYLNCGSHNLTTLDLSKNVALTYLDCFDNYLTSLDLSKNTALTKLYCKGNQLTLLDLSNNAALKFLDCCSNDLTSLDLSKSTALSYLQCQNNQLTSLDLNAALKFLDCSSNYLISLDLSKNTALTELYCWGNSLTKIILNRNNKIDDSCMRNIINDYGENIIEYVE